MVPPGMAAVGLAMPKPPVAPVSNLFTLDVSLSLVGFFGIARLLNLLRQIARVKNCC